MHPQSMTVQRSTIDVPLGVCWITVNQPFSTLALVEAALKLRSAAELMALAAECGQWGHSWRDLTTDLVMEGRHAHCCTHCLRVAIGGGAEFWSVMPE